jgi:hypothetical protein
MYTIMKAYVLIGFIALVIVVLSLITSRERFNLKDRVGINRIKTRIGAIEARIEDSDKKRAESAGTLNSTLR